MVRTDQSRPVRLKDTMVSTLNRMFKPLPGELSFLTRDALRRPSVNREGNDAEPPVRWFVRSGCS